MSLNGMGVRARWLLLKARRRLAAEVIQKLYWDANRDIRRSMILAGVGRSGTTWLSEIISSQVLCRVMTEPFNPYRVAAFSRFPDFQYKRTDDSDLDLYAYARRVLQGDIRDRWIDRRANRIFSEYRLVKEIRANLFLKWLHGLFPDVPLLFVIRHPCAVVLSRMEAGWGADADLDAFLSQPMLISDFLADKMDIIKSAWTEEGKHAILWCIQHIVLSKQFQPGELPVVFYERLCLQPETELDIVFGALNQPYSDSVLKQVDKPSRTTSRKSAILTGEDRATRWRSKLSPQQIDSILSVVAALGMDHIYGDADVPVSQSLWG
jgi:hypothetical protein